MSTVAIVVTKGTIFAGSAAMSSACLAMGIGVGAAFYLQYRHELREEQRQRLTRDLDNACYRIRQRIESLPDELQGQFNTELAQLQQLQDAATTAIAQDDLCAVPLAISSLHGQYAALRRRVEPLLITLQEPSAAALDAASHLQQYLDTFADLASLLPLRAALQKILQDADPADLEQAIAELRNRADALIAGEQQKAGGVEEPAPLVQAPDSRERRRNALRDEARRFYLLLARLDAAVAAPFLPLLAEVADSVDEQRLALVRDSIRLTYGEVKEATAASVMHREALQTLPEQVRQLPGGTELATLLESLLEQPLISAEEYRGAVQQAHDLLYRYHEEQALLARVQDTLEQLGYATLAGKDGITEAGLLAGEVFFVETPWEGYRVMLRLSPQGELLTRLVRLVATEDERKTVSTYQKQKDLEVARRWCHDYDKLIAGMELQGITCAVNLRKAPEEEEVLYLVDAAAAPALRLRSGHDTTAGIASNRALP